MGKDNVIIKLLVHKLNYISTPFTHGVAVIFEATLLVMPMVFSPRWSERPGALRPFVGSKGEVGQWVLTIALFTYMTILILTQTPASGAIILGSAVLIGVEGTLRQDG